MENNDNQLPKSLKELSVSVVKFIETVDKDKLKKNLNTVNTLKNE